MRKAGAKEDSEGSIGTEGAIDVNRSPFSTASTGRRSDLMIRLCTCSGKSSSSLPLGNLNNTDSMTCKGCGGESTTDGGPSCSNKLHTMVLEPPRLIDPEVRWKTVNRRQRATRRARTSFSGEDRMKDEMKSFYACGSATSQEMAQVDAPVSESEKLGVSILGRRFSDPMENVPIKKRRFHMDCSPSPPPTPLLVDPFEKLLSRSRGDISSYGKRCKVKTVGCENREGKKGSFDSDDFSGISILAAAACESEIDGDILSGECSKSAHFLEEMKPENVSGCSELSLAHEIKEDRLNIPGASHCKPDRPLESSESARDKALLPSQLNSSQNLIESASAPKANHVLYASLRSANKTDDSSSPSDAKSSAVTISNSSSNPDKFTGCLQDTVVQTKCSNDTRDSRLHWDLNVAMEAWDTDCGDGEGDMVCSDPVASSVRDCNDAENEMNKSLACQDLSDLKVACDVPDLSADKIHVVDAPKDVRAKDESDFPGDSSSHPLHSRLHQNLQLLESKSLDGNDSYAESKDLPYQKGDYVCKVESYLQSNPDCNALAPITEHVALIADVEKLDVSHASPLDFEGLSHSASADGHGEGNSIQASEMASKVKPFANRLVSEESTNLATVFSKSFTDLGWNDNKLGQASQQSITEFKNQEPLDVDSGTSKIDQSVHHKAGLDTDLFSLPKGAEDADNLNLPDPHPENNLGSSDCDVAHGLDGDDVSATVNHKKIVFTCANSSSAETCYFTSDATKDPRFDLECTKLAVTDVDIIVDSQSAGRSYPNGYTNEIGKVASNNCLEHCYATDASHITKNLAGTGKVDAEEDDSQYEDGELRESGDRYWVDDGFEEVKCVNYKVSNYKEEERAPDIPLPLGSNSKNMGTAVTDYNETQSRKEDADVSPVSSKRSWSTNCLDDGSGMMVAGSPGENARSVHLRVKGENRMYETNRGCILAGSVATVGLSERGSDGFGDDLLSMRTKSSGWDMLPEDQRRSQHDSRDRVDSSNRCVLSTLDAVGGGESFRQMGLSNRDVKPPVDRPRSFDRPHRNELCRSDDGYGSGSKTERSVDSQRLLGRGGASRHAQASNREEQWVENSNNSRSSRRRSPDYYNYSSSGPRNAAEAAVAKMESNGFVVARDGTLVRAADAANAGSMTRRMRNSINGSYRPLSGRGSPIDRDGACGLSRGPAHAREVSPEQRFGASGNRSGRYGPEMDKGRISDGNMSSIRCSLSSRQRRFPQHRASLNLSRTHSRSRSGSRSRSPHTWTSPRNRRDTMANGGASLHRHSRSPSNNYITEVRIGRMTSPQRQPGFDDRVMRYSPSSRNRTYSQNASTWADGRNYSTADPSDNKKRYSRRSPPLRIPSRNDRFDAMDSQGRLRSGELYRPSQGRLPYGFDRGRGNKHNGNSDDQREYAERYETRSAMPYDRNGSVKQFGNHTGDKIRPHISAPRSPELQRRGSPRRYERSFGQQLDSDLPRGPKEDNKNPFRYD